jgi:hypothetical protein
MANFLGRNDRRRRVLNEDALAASTSHVALRARDADKNVADNAPRYSDAAGVEHHPQVTDFLPRRYRTIAAAALAGVVVTASVVALDWCAIPWAIRLGVPEAVPLAIGTADGLAAWLSASLLLLTAATCLLIYSLRRHRIDDFRGRYRVWLAAAVAGVVLSADSIASVHELLAVVATHLTQHGALRGYAAWWLAAAGVPLAWIGARLLLDARESGLAAVALVAAFACYALSLVSYLVGWPVANPASEVLVTIGARLLGNWMLLVGVASYGRFVVLDVQGLIAKERRRPRRQKVKTPEKDSMVTKSALVGRSSDVQKTNEGAAATDGNSIRSFRQNLNSARPTAMAQASETRWVDGSEPLRDDYDDEDGNRGDSKLSKSDRKRLRKLKAQHRAA